MNIARSSSKVRMADLIQGKPLDMAETDSMVPSTQYITHQGGDSDEEEETDDQRLTAEAELDSSTGHLRVRVSRPVYSQKRFDDDYQHHSRRKKTMKERMQNMGRKNACSGACFKRILYKYLPFTKILQGYSFKRDLINDLISGLTVGIMHLPQGMAYGLLANLPPVYGLYTSFFPVLVYFLFGTSKHISKGTFAVVSLMVGSVVEKEGLCPSPAPQDTGADTTTLATYAGDPFNGSVLNSTSPPGVGVEMSQEELWCKVGVATSVTFVVGVYQLLMGVFRLGFAAIYLSDPLTRGFTTATAVHVLTSQLRHMFGVPVDRFSGAFKIIYWYIDFFQKITLTNVASLIMCILCMAVIYLTKEYINPRVKAKIKMPVPIELIVIIVTTLISYFAKFNEHFDMIVVGNIPTGIPGPSVPPVARRFSEVYIDAVGIALVAFAVDLSMGKLLANKHDYQVQPNQELRAYGITNIVCSFFNCFVAVASLSRSLIQEAVGGVTQIAGLFSCCLLMLVLLFVGPLFEQLPNNVLSAIVIVNLKGMFMQLLDLKILWRASKTDFLIWLVVFLSTVLIDVDLGLFIGLGFSLLTVVYRMQTPYTSLLGRVPHTDIYKDMAIYKSAHEIEGIKIFRFESSLVYSNVEHFVKKLYKKTVNPRSLKQAKAKAATKNHNHMILVEMDVEANNKDQTPDKNGDAVAVVPNSSSPLKSDELTGSTTMMPSDPSPVKVTEPVTSPDLSVPKVVILDCSTMAEIDYPGVTGMIKVIKEYKDVGVSVMLAACKGSVREMLEIASQKDLSSPKGKSYKVCPLYLSVHDAVVAAINMYPDISQALGDEHSSLLSLASQGSPQLSEHSGHKVAPPANVSFVVDQEEPLLSGDSSS